MYRYPAKVDRSTDQPNVLAWIQRPIENRQFGLIFLSMDLHRSQISINSLDLHRSSHILGNILTASSLTILQITLILSLAWLVGSNSAMISKLFGSYSATISKLFSSYLAAIKQAFRSYSATIWQHFSNYLKASKSYLTAIWQLFSNYLEAVEQRFDSYSATS